MKTFATVLLAALLCTTIVHAQADPDPDGIGIYADLDATQVSIQAEPGEIFPVYLILTRPSQTLPIICWSAMVVAPTHCDILAWNIEGTTFMNYAAPPQFNVCFPDGLAPEPVTHLLTFYCRMTSSQAGYFYVVGSPLAGEPFSDAPCYLIEGDHETPYFLHGYPGGIQEPMFAVNGELTPTENLSWSGVKNLFD